MPVQLNGRSGSCTLARQEFGCGRDPFKEVIEAPRSSVSAGAMSAIKQELYCLFNVYGTGQDQG